MFLFCLVILKFTRTFCKLYHNIGHDCKGRCKDKNATFPLCTAATEPHFDLDTHMHNTIFSPDPVKNPAFFDYNIGRYNEHLI